MIKERYKLVILYVLQILIIIAPVLAVIIVRRNDYITSPSKSFALSFGAIVAFIIMILQVLNKMPKDIHLIVKLGVASVFLWMLRPILDELCLLLTCAFGGELLGWLVCSHAIKMQKIKIGLSERRILNESLTSGDDSIGRV